MLIACSQIGSTTPGIGLYSCLPIFLRPYLLLLLPFCRRDTQIGINYRSVNGIARKWPIVIYLRNVFLLLSAVNQEACISSLASLWLLLCNHLYTHIKSLLMFVALSLIISIRKKLREANCHWTICSGSSDDIDRFVFVAFHEWMLCPREAHFWVFSVRARDTHALLAIRREQHRLRGTCPHKYETQCYSYTYTPQGITH